MLSELERGPRVVGIRQTRRALCGGRAARVYLAADADEHLVGALAQMCQERGVPVEQAGSMRKLGRACGLSVGSAAAAVLHT